MDDDQIHGDVIAKLWQVYSMYLTIFFAAPTHLNMQGSEKQLPREQRRGAIIILGMLALARRSVVTDRVDILLKIGLGAFGRVSEDSWPICAQTDKLPSG